MSGSTTGWLQPTARAYMRTRPLPTRPIIHALARTPAPTTPLDQQTRYPKHPLNAFFHQELYRITPPTGTPGDELPRIAPASNITSPLQTAKGEVEVHLPAVLPESLFGHDSSSRSYLAPELRLKSSHELHALWYVLLMERNRLATSRDEAKRLGLANLMQMHRTNMGARAHRVRKSMARIKLVLNERRLALIQAQQDVRLASTSAATSNEQDLLNAAAAEMEEVDLEEGGEGEGNLYEEADEKVVERVATGEKSQSSSGRL
ncbi:hypothetical protein CF327_g7313 [Tilletia walkeri]|uniref:Large ribosomal subunit protein uL29m n=1 Tax=Tilletia walkeri TaxID=117179 RepID=A0A8X7N419_9BASI|nr:hypothetical protein CF327_g7313 [Tilletia walkeri]KAE8264341.1 hypothetical protein A4X09_0g6993 [Tilletia walkeri]